MKTIKILGLLMVLGSPVARACDVCGCNLSGVYFGFSPLVQSHYLGLNYQYASFRAAIDNDDYYFQDEWSHDTYQRLEVVGRLRLADRWQLRAGLPIVRQQMDGNVQQVQVTGLADPTLTVHYTPFYSGDDFTREVMQSLVVGLGVKMPLGQIDLEHQGALVNPNFQPGTGSWDALLTASHTLRYRNWGWNTEATAKLNGTNALGYRVGEQVRASGTAFYFWETATGSWLPQLGAQWEAGQPHTQHGLVRGNTGGQNLFATLGLQYFRSQIGLNLQAQLPLWQQFNTDQNVTLHAEPRATLSLIYSLGSE